ncbi:glycosyltransferase family 2 protein, partial [Enterococcus faecalis]|nr:glycosyltransferase family 2 protein [Enterococcus faecalis]
MYAYEIIWGVIYLVSNKVRAGVNGWKRYLYQLLCLFIIPIYILNAIESIGKQTY